MGVLYYVPSGSLAPANHTAARRSMRCGGLCPLRPGVPEISPLGSSFRTPFAIVAPSNHLRAFFMSPPLWSARKNRRGYVHIIEHRGFKAGAAFARLLQLLQEFFLLMQACLARPFQRHFPSFVYITANISHASSRKHQQRKAAAQARSWRKACRCVAFCSGDMYSALWC